MNKIKIILILLLFQLNLSAQEDNDTIPLPDSLVNKLALSKSNDDSIKIYLEISEFQRKYSILNRLGFALKADSISKTKDLDLKALINITLAKGYFNYRELKIARMHLDLAKKHYIKDTSTNAQKRLLDIYGLYAYSFYIEEEHEKAIENYLYAEKIIEKLNDTTKFAADIYLRLARSYFSLKVNEKSSKLYFKALHLYTQIDDTVMVSEIYNALGIIYSKQKEYKQAIEFYIEFFKYSNMLKNEMSIALALNNIGYEFSLVGKYDSAEVYLKKSIKKSIKINDTIYLPNTYHSLGSMYLKLGNYTDAVLYLKKAEKYSDKNDEELKCHIYLDLANVSIKKKDFKKALGKLKIAENLAIKNNLKYAYIDILKAYSQIYFSEANFEKAIEYEKQISQKESLINSEEINRNLANLNIEYTVKKLETKIQQLEKITKIQAKNVNEESLRNLYTLGFILFLVVLGAGFLFLRRINNKYRRVLKQKNKQFNQNKQSLESVNIELTEINASKDHFFNLIASNLKKPFITLLDYSERIIKDYDKLTKEEIVKYNELINFTAQDLFELLENLLYWSRFEIGTLELNTKKYKFNEFVEDNLAWFRNKVNSKGVFLNTNLSEDVFVKFDKILMSLVLRNLVSNAIEKTNQSGVVKITTLISGTWVELSVEDNGDALKGKQIENIFSIKHIEDITTKGLGLIVSNKIVELHTSKLTILNKKKIGTRLSFRLNLN